MKRLFFYSLCCLLLTLLTACGKEGNRPQTGVVQTGFPGQVSAGGGTSGTVMAQSGAGKTSASMPSGTPGIPKGAEGNVGGTQSAGTTAATAAKGEQGGEEKGKGGEGEAKDGASEAAAPAAPPVREGRGTTAPDASTAGSTAHGKVADSPSPAKQARKEHAK